MPTTSILNSRHLKTTNLKLDFGIATPPNMLYPPFILLYSLFSHSSSLILQNKPGWLYPINYFSSSPHPTMICFLHSCNSPLISLPDSSIASEESIIKTSIRVNSENSGWTILLLWPTKGYVFHLVKGKSSNGIWVPCTYSWCTYDILIPIISLSSSFILIPVTHSVPLYIALPYALRLEDTILTLQLIPPHGVRRIPWS